MLLLGVQSSCIMLSYKTWGVPPHHSVEQVRINLEILRLKSDTVYIPLQSLDTRVEYYVYMPMLSISLSCMWCKLTSNGIKYHLF